MSGAVSIFLAATFIVESTDSYQFKITFSFITIFSKIFALYLQVDCRTKIEIKKLKKTADSIELKTIADAMLEKKGKNVCSLDLRAIGTSICDYFVICNADSGTNVISIADNIEEQMLVKCNRKVVRMQGRENAFWIIMDYANIVVHIFQTEYRQFYRLEDLWADAKMTKYGEEE